MTFPTALSLMSAALALYVAALNHRFSRAPGWRDQRWFSLVALSVAGFAAMNLPITVSSSDSIVLVAARVQLLFAVTHSAGWFLYSRSQLERPPRRWEHGVVATLLVLGAASLVPGAVYALPVRRTYYEPLGVRYAVPTATVLGELVFVALVATLAVVTVRCAVAWRRRSRYALMHLVTLVLFVAMVANDALVGAGVYSGPYLVDLAFLIPIAAVGYSITSRFADDAHAVAELRLRLESLVDERTRELSQAQDALHRAEKLAALGQFATGVAHEVNNPSAVVSANLKYLDEYLERGELPGDARDCVQESLSAVQRITAIARQLLDAGRLAANKVPLEPVSLASCVREAASMARARVPERVSIGATIDEDLFALGQERIIVQVLVNLLVNGAQAVPESRRGRVAVRAERPGSGRVRVLIEDDGVGMDEEVLRRAFDPFFTTKPVGVGTGLGLAVSRGLAASLGATLTVESTPGRGTRAIFDLAVAARPSALTAEAAPVAPAGRKRSVLLLDDEPAVLRALTRVLEPHYTVRTAASVDEAFALADLHRPDILLCDVVMPDGGGEALYRALAQQHPELARRVVFLTGGAARDTVRRFLGAQPQPVMEKPLDLAALAPIVGRLAPEEAVSPAWAVGSG